MSTITFRSPVRAKLHRNSAPQPPVGEFRVTQRFDSPDYYWSNVPNPPKPLPTHRAVDIGNFRCGDPILAMAPGVARRVQDNAIALGAKSNALGIVIDHGQGITTEYWHLASWTVVSGARVAAGQEIGKVGATGLGAVCHTHIEAKRNGVRFDPEPLLFGGSIGEEVDVDLPTGLIPLAQGVVGQGNNLRVDPNTRVGAKLTDKAYFVQIYGRTSGETWTIGTRKDNEYLWVGVFDRTWFVAEPLVTQIEPTGVGRALLPSGAAADCTQEVAAAKAEGAKAGAAAGFTDAKTKARLAVEAIK